MVDTPAAKQNITTWWTGTTHFAKHGKTTWTSLIATTDEGQPVQATTPPDAWDGNPITSERMPVPKPSWVYRATAANVEEDDDILESSSNDENDKQTNKMTRQQRKAMDREIPWRTIVNGNPKILDLYIAANQKEYRSWMEWNGVVPVEDAEAEIILADPVLKKRVILARNAYRNKNHGAGPGIEDIIAKRRTVILGHHDPDLASLGRASPTPSKFSKSVLLQLACSGLNSNVENTGKKWHLWAGDVKTAFLQGTPEAQHERLWMRPPRDGIQRLANTFPHRLYLIQGNLYGFASGPKTWSTHICKTLLDMNLTQHRYDKMMFYKRDPHGHLLVLLIVHVDDFLVQGAVGVQHEVQTG